MTKPNPLSRMLHTVFVMPCVLVLFVAAGQSQSAVLTTSSEAAAATSPSNVTSNGLAIQSASSADVQMHEARISPGDIVEVKIFGVPDMSQELRVNNGGNIVVPLVGQVRAQGLTTAELEQKLAAALRDGGVMNDPQVNVAAKELHSAVVSVTGEVGKPGIYPVFGSCRLLDMITIAGGLTPSAGHVVTLTRGDKPDSPISVDISNNDVKVFPGDSVLVAKAGIVYVLGNVGHPAAFSMENRTRMTVLEVLALAGGTSANAKISGARIIRKSPQGIREVPIPLKEILKAQKEDMELLAGDVLYIPNSEGKAALRIAGTSIITAAAALAITHP